MRCKIKIKKLLVIILTLCLVAFAFTACNNEPPATNLPTPPEQTTPVEPSNPNNPSENEPDKPDTPVNPPMPETEKAYEISEGGKTVYFGSYPTTQVADSSVIASLSAIAGEPSDSDNFGRLTDII